MVIELISIPQINMFEVMYRILLKSYDGVVVRQFANDYLIFVPQHLHCDKQYSYNILFIVILS